MNLFTTITSERGKPVTKSGNEFIEIELKDENRQVIATIKVKYNQMTIWHGNNLDVRSYKDTSMDKPKTAREDDLSPEWRAKKDEWAERFKK